MPLVPNAAALAEGFVPARADEVRPGDVLWDVRYGRRPVEPVALPDGRVLIGIDLYGPSVRVYRLPR